MHLVFVNDNGLATQPGTNGKPYPLDHLRVVALQPGQDEQTMVTWYKASIPSLGTYLGLRDLPADRFFRDAWRHVNGAVVIDMPTARTIRQRQLLARRDLLLKTATAAQQTALLALDQSLPGQLAAITDPILLKTFVPPILA